MTRTNVSKDKHNSEPESPMAKTNKYYPVRAPAAAVKQGRNRGPTVTQRRIVEAAEADKTRAATRAARAAKAPSKAQQLLRGLLTMASATAGNVYGRVKMHSTKSRTECTMQVQTESHPRVH